MGTVFATGGVSFCASEVMAQPTQSANDRPEIRSYASMYRSRVASTISAGSGGGGVSDARVPAGFGAGEPVADELLVEVGCTFPASYPSAGQYRDESGVRTSSARTRLPSGQSELELGVREDDAAVRGEVGRAAVDVEGVVAQLHGQVLAHLVDHGLEADVLVVLAAAPPCWRA